MKQPRYDVPKAAPAPLRLVQQFVNTFDHEHGREWLASPADLRRWLEEHGLTVPAARVGNTALERAVALREALRALLVANNGGSLDSRAVGTLNREAAQARLVAQLDERGDVHLVPLASGAADGALGQILGVAFAAAAEGSWRRLKACRNCRWAFYDYSKNRSATWCAMALCGNRLKTRTYRARRGNGRT